MHHKQYVTVPVLNNSQIDFHQGIQNLKYKIHLLCSHRTDSFDTTDKSKLKYTRKSFIVKSPNNLYVFNM